LTERQAKVREAWGKAYHEIAEFYPKDVDLVNTLRGFAPGMADKIQQAEREAEAASVRWMEGGPGGVQVAINLWRDLWREAVELLTHG